MLPNPLQDDPRLSSWPLILDRLESQKRPLNICFFSSPFFAWIAHLQGVPKTAIRMLRARLGDPILGNFRPSRLSFGSFFGHLAPFEQIWSYKIWSQNIFENLVSNLVSMTPRRWRMFNSMQSQIKWTALFKRRLTVEPLGERLPSVVAYCLLRQEEVGAPQKSGHYVILCYRSSPLLLLA